MKLGLRTSARPPDAPHPMQAALDEAMAFTPALALTLTPDVPPADIRSHAAAEAAFGRIAVDGRGLTPGTLLHLVDPVRRPLGAWQAARQNFDRVLQPKLPDLLAVQRLDAEIAELQEKRRLEIEEAEHAWNARPEHQTIRRRWEDAEALYTAARDSHGRRDAVMRAYHWSYWIALLCIGVAEWLINYDVFFQFLGVPAIAAGATLVLGVLLAYSAHGHGTLLRQWSHRFGAHQIWMKRTADFRLLALATFGLAIVLLAAGGSRYAAVLHAQAAQPAQNILGSIAVVEVDPLRDVLISLLANLAAWAVGVFIAYFCHDEDPEFMDATRQHQRAGRGYYRARRRVDDLIQTIKARTAKDVEGMELAARARAAGVAPEQAMLDQVARREAAILDTLAATLRGRAEQYRDTLAQLALTSGGGLSIALAAGGKALSPYEYRALPILIDAAFVRGLTI